MYRRPRGIISVSTGALEELLQLKDREVYVKSATYEHDRMLLHVYVYGEGCKDIPGWVDVAEGAISPTLRHAIRKEQENPLEGLRWREKIAKIYSMLK